ncbi:hypothetical protein Tco_0572861 [Tanacetum coccineum]
MLAGDNLIHSMPYKIVDGPIPSSVPTKYQRVASALVLWIRASDLSKADGPISLLPMSSTTRRERFSHVRFRGIGITYKGVPSLMRLSDIGTTLADYVPGPEHAIDEIVARRIIRMLRMASPTAMRDVGDDEMTSRRMRVMIWTSRTRYKVIVGDPTEALFCNDIELGAHVREFESMVRRDTDEIYTRLYQERLGSRAKDAVNLGSWIGKSLHTTFKTDVKRIGELQSADRSRHGQVTALQGQVMALQGQVTALQGQQGPAGGPAQPELPEEAGSSS